MKGREIFIIGFFAGISLTFFVTYGWEWKKELPDTIFIERYGEVVMYADVTDPKYLTDKTGYKYLAFPLFGPNSTFAE